MDVLTAAWKAGGSPQLAAHTDHLQPAGRCDRCGQPGAELVSTLKAVSKAFTAFDHWKVPGGRTGLCPACAWAYGEPQLRRAVHLIEQNPPSAAAVPRPAACTVLEEGQLSQARALVVPLRPGRKHLLPLATWGHVTTEEGALRWDAADAARLRVIRRLRAHGFRPVDLRKPAPPFQALRSLEPSLWSDVMAQWDRIAPWHAAGGPWLDLALHLTPQ